MILRRVATALREQNWSTITIEFLLLVVGVFLGIQAANWNQARVTQQRAAEFTERLRADLLGEAWCSTTPRVPPMRWKALRR